MTRRYEYALHVSDFPASGDEPSGDALSFRAPAESDSAALAELMIDAYRGTIDYDGETIDDARREVQSYFQDVSGRPLLDCSWLCFESEQLASACLVSLWRDRPLIAYVMTGAAWKNRSLAAQLLQRALRSLAQKGYRDVRAAITEGNTPSEALFIRAGFVKDQHDTMVFLARKP